MNAIFKRKGTRLLSALLAVFMVVAMLPMSAFAWSTEEGTKCTSTYGDRYRGSDGDYYYSKAGNTLFYNDDGSFYVTPHEGGNAKYKYLMIDGSGNYHQVYCIEAGVTFNYSDSYTGTSGKNSRYFQNLPITAQFGIMMALMYGWHEGTTSPVAGTNDDDFAYATQCIIWEYQQQIRTSPTSIAPANGVEADLFYATIQNRPAEKCYNWILEQMARHYTIPSFSSRSESSAQTYTLKYDAEKDNYSLTLTDTNNTLADIDFSASGIAVTRNGNQYTFTSKGMISNAVTVTAQKKTNLIQGKMLIWGCPGKQTMASGAEDPVYFYFKLNTETKGIGHIVKTSEDGKVEGVRFTVSGNGVNETVVTGADGTVDLDLLPGIYTVTELAEDKYEPQESRQVTVVSGQTATITFNNKLKRGDLTVTKNAEDGLEQGAKFHLFGTSLSGLAVDEYAIVGPDGKAYFRDVLIGTGYTLEEVDTPDRYVVPDDQKADIEWKKVTNKSFDNDLKRGDLTVTKTAEDGLEQGAKFHLFGTSLSGLAVDEYAIVGSDGKAHFKDVLIGTGYTLEEVDTPDRYVVPDDQKADIEWKKVTNKSFENDLKRGDLTVTKTAEDGLTEGMQFRLHGTSYSGLPVDETRSVGADGKAYFNDILIGTGYVLEEVGTPNRYVVPDNQITEIEWKKVTNKDFHNTLKKWNLTVTKRDSETGMPQGDATLAGAVYGIYQGDELIDTYTTDASGSFTTSYYVCGDDWSIREITPSEGYLLDETVYHVGAEAKNYTVEYNAAPAIGSPEDIIKGKIAIIKHTDDGETQIETPETGAEFEVFLKTSGSYDAAKDSERDILTCDENGFAETKLLPYGVYTVHQTKGWEGRELLPDFDVYIAKDGQTYRYLANNSNFESYLKIIKVDAETGNPIPYAGAGFQIYRPDGSLVTQTFTYPEITTIDTFYTTAEGFLITAEPLEYGIGYSLVEVAAPYGYVLDSDPVYFDITQDNSTEESAVTVVKVVMEDMPQKGVIKVSKTGEVFSSVVQSGDIYQPVYEVKGLPGAVYEIIAAEDVYTPDGTLRYAKGTVADTVTTGADGNAISKALYLGKYEIREIAAPYGMTLNPDPVSVELTYAGQEIKITETATEFYNERQKVQIDLSKVMEQDETFDIGNNSEILSVQFGLFAAEDIVAADGSTIPKGGLIETVTCDENGYAVFATDLPVGAKLYVKEIATDSHYILSDTQYPVEFAYAGQDTATVHITVGDEPLVNELIYGSVKGHKTDRETGENIAGAVFGLFASDATEYTEENAILTAVTGEDGVFTFEDIPYGSYVVAELVPAEGYLPNEEIYPVCVTTDGEVIEISVVNDRIPEIGTTATVEGEKEVNATEVFTLEDVVAYEHLIPGKEYVLKGVLMDKTTGEPLLLNGEEIRSETTFMPETPSGEVTVSFTFDSKYIKADTDVVVFESLYKDGLELTVHADIDDEGQTVTVHVPEIGTQATAEGKKEVEAKGEITIEDTVSYKNLTPGREYTVSGVLMNKATGEPFTVNGKEIRSEVTFTPKTAAGEVIVKFTFDATGLTTATEVVVFESLYREGVEIAVHADIEDDRQTVKLTPPTPDVPKTGDESNIGFWIGLCAVALGGFVATIIIGNKRKKGDE